MVSDSSSVRPIRVSITVSVTMRSSIRLTGVLTPMVPQTSMITLPLTKTAGYTQRSYTMEPMTLAESTSTVSLTGKVISVLLTVADTSLSVDVTMVREITQALSTMSLSGMKHLLQPRLLTSLQVEAQSHHLLTLTVTDSLTHGRTSMRVTSPISVQEFTLRLSLLLTVLQT